MNKALINRWIPLALALVVACSTLIFQWQYRHDNKYTAWRPRGDSGVMWMDSEGVWAQPDLLLHLVDGWVVYENKLLTPDDIGSHTSDRTLYLGQYSGLNFGDRTRPVYGDATYRATILTDGVTRAYGLELPEIYSAYRLWINGQELAGMGAVGEDYRPEIGGGMLAFQAGASIDIIVQVSDRDGYYSGMVYPPAFGSVGAVQRVQNGRILTHGFAWAVALVLGVFALLPWQGWKQGGRRQLLLALFCLFFILYTGYPLLHGWGLTGTLWYGVERMSRQLMTACLLLITGELCAVPRRIAYPAACAGILVALLMLYPQALPGWDQGGIYTVSAVLRWWHRLASLLLVAFGAWGIGKRRVASAGLLAGALIFACATVMDQVHRLYEPILTGFYAETAGFLILLILAGVLRREAWEVQRERADLRERQALLETRIEYQMQAAASERAYMERVHTMRHDMQGQLGLLRGYLEKDRAEEALGYLDTLLATSGGDEPYVHYTGHTLVDDLLNAGLTRIQRMGGTVECSASWLEDDLPFSDEHLMRLLLNILGNAAEALERVEPEERRLTLLLVQKDCYLSISCANTCAHLPRERDGLYRSTKTERGHGLGLPMIRRIAGIYKGNVIITTDFPLFKIQVLLRTDCGDATAEPSG